MTIYKADFWFCITELVARNPNLGIPALEDGLFAKLLIFEYLYYICFKGKGRGKGKGHVQGKGKREGKREGGITCIVMVGGGGGQTPLQNCSGW